MNLYQDYIVVSCIVGHNHVMCCIPMWRRYLCQCEYSVVLNDDKIKNNLKFILRAWVI